ncbi:MAG: hypothetical protein DCF30_09850 [Hyphomicrobiales bacterium]|nr:MAG: hypothetical protein DCF30_09850 [Hyphomicrobiales bacterium]
MERGPQPEDQALSEHFRLGLVQERIELEALLAQTASDSAPVELDQQSVGRLARMDAMQMQAMAQEAVRRRSTRLLRIKQALQRIDDGEFGSCTTCGELISIGRLTADPTYHRCIKCASG